MIINMHVYTQTHSILTKFFNEWLEFLVPTQWQNSTFIWCDNRGERQVLKKANNKITHTKIFTNLYLLHIYFYNLPWAWVNTVLCSSPSRVLKLCSNIAYMIRPIPNEGSITDGTISSTVKLNEANWLYYEPHEINSYHTIHVLSYYIENIGFTQ